MTISIKSKNVLLFKGDLTDDQWATINDLLNEMVEENESTKQADEQRMEYEET